jgi:hypothetical protein
VPVVSPVMGMVPEPAWDRMPVIPPGFDVAVYRVIVEPPLLAGAVKATVADVEVVAITAPIPGAPGLAADACAAIKNDISAVKMMKIFLNMFISKMYNSKKCITPFTKK